MFGIASPARKCHKTELGARGTSIYKVGFFYSFAFLHLYVFVWVALRKAHSRPYTQDLRRLAVPLTYSRLDGSLQACQLAGRRAGKQGEGWGGDLWGL